MRFVLVLLLAVNLAGCGFFSSDSESLFPERNRWVIFLPDEESGVVRQEQFLADNGNALMTRTAYKDGSESIVHHRPDDSSRQSWTLLYPQAEGEDARVEKVVFFDGDERYARDRSFRPDGTIERAGKRLDDGTYDVTLFFDGGVLKQRHLVFAADDKPAIEETFRPDQSRIFITRHLGHKTTTTHYRPDGRRLMEVDKDRLDNTTTAYFDEKGEGVERIVKLTNLETVVIYLDKQGRKLQRREFWDDRLFLDVFDENEHVAYRQRWIRSGGTDDNPQFRIDGLVFLTARGKIEKTIDLNSDGKTVSELVIIHNPGEFIEDRTFVFFDSNGVFRLAKRQLGESGEGKELSWKEVLKLRPSHTEPGWLTMPPPHEWPERVTPPLGHSDLEE